MDKVHSTINQTYDDSYTGSDVEWRTLCADLKVKNLVAVCEGLSFKKVLEVGAGDGSILYHLDRLNFCPELYALEIAQSGVKLIKSRQLANLIDVQVFDGYKIPYADNSFDLVILSHVLEHVEYERLLIRELKRVAKYIAIEVPLDYRFGVDKRMKHFLGYGHINMYTPSSLRFLLKSEGLDILKEKTTLITPEISKYGEFVNRKTPKTVSKILRIELEFRIKKVLGKVLGKNRTETLANAYTVLTKKTDKALEIF